MSMRNMLGRLGLAAVLMLGSGAAFAQTGTSQSWGTFGWGPQIPTQEMTPKNRSWNFNHEAENWAIITSEWNRNHGGGGFLGAPR